MNETFYETGVLESKEIKENGETKLVVFDRNGNCTYSTSEDYESESILKLHRDYYKVED